MVVDTFYFNGELETLEVRLTLLSPFVDKFVMLEAKETFTGVAKELTYITNLKRFRKWNNKIDFIGLPVGMNDMEILNIAKSSSNVGGGEHYWVREFYQKECLRKALIGFNDEDIIFISDVDEVWNPEILNQVKGDRLYKPLQESYLYYLNNKTGDTWKAFTGTVVTKYKNIKGKCINHLRTHSKNEYVFIENGGWHWNALGGVDNKINSFKHPVYTHEYMKSRENGARIDNSGLPNLDNFKHLCLPEHK